MSFFTYRGTDSRTYGILKRCPMRPKSELNYNEISIPSRTEKMLISTGIYSDIILEDCTLGLKSKQKIREIYSWLSGTGELVFSDRPWEKLIVKKIILSPEYLSVRYGNIKIQFTCAPFAYAIEPTQVQIGKEYTAVENTSSIYSEPVIQIKMQKSSSTILKGDVDMDGKITAADAALVMEEIANIAGGGEPTFTPEQFEAADMDGDGKLTAADVSAILSEYASGASKDPAAPVQNVVINTNGAKLIVGIPSEVLANGFTVTIDCGLHLIYYTDLSGNMVNILHYSSLDLPLLHEGTNYMKYTGDNVESVTVTINERWL